MSNWLGKQRMTELRELANKAGLEGISGLKKDDLIQALDKYISSNAANLASEALFEPYFSETETKASKSSRPRRATKSPSDFNAEASPERPSVAAALPSRTPRTVQRAAARVPLPPSPSAVTDMVERQTTALSNRASSYLNSIGITDYAESARESLSTVYALQCLLAIFEAYGLQRAMLPWRYAFTVPGLKVLNPLSVSFPDLFVFLTADFWAPASLWLLTNIVFPALVGWFFNFTWHSSKRNARYTVDPLTFSLVKALTAYVTYGPPLFTFGGYVDAITATRVSVALPGSWYGTVIGGSIGMIASLYEAVLRK